MIINHQFLNQKFFFPHWKIETLVLGTFNPECAEITDYFYGRSRNRFWKAIENLTDNEHNFFLNNFNRKKSFMEKYKFGCTDLIIQLILMKITSKKYAEKVTLIVHYLL